MRPLWRTCSITFAMERYIGSRTGRGRICTQSVCSFGGKSVNNGRLLTHAICSKVFISFGGLLLYMEGPYKKMTPLRVDYVYLLMKK